MKILSIESSALVASCAICTEDTLIAEYTTNFKKTHSQTLMPMIDEICKMTDTDKTEFEAIAVCSGPGSFTGLRIGAATAKGLGLALNIPLIPVPTLSAMAYNFVGTDKLVVPIMDARRKQVYAGIYRFEPKFDFTFCSDSGRLSREDLNVEKGFNRFTWKMSRVMDDTPMALSDLLDKLNDMGKEVVFLGDGVNAFRQIIEETAVFPFAFAPSNQNMQRASSLGALAIEMYKRGTYISADKFAPDYFRLSQAEREAMEKTK